MLETSTLLNELEEIKQRVISIEIEILRKENPTKEDVKDVKLALREYREGKTLEEAIDSSK